MLFTYEKSNYASSCHLKCYIKISIPNMIEKIETQPSEQAFLMCLAQETLLHKTCESMQTHFLEVVRLVRYVGSTFTHKLISNVIVINK